MLKRTPVGIPGVDTVLKGGLLQGRSYLLTGEAGTGKTIFSLQWLIDGRSQKEKCLFMTLAEPTGDISENVWGMGWNLEGIEVVDLTPGDYQEVEKWEDEYHVFAPNEVEDLPYWRSVYEAIQTHKPQRLVLDSLTQLRYVSADDFQFRKKVMLLVALLSKMKCTGIFLYEPMELAQDSSVALAVDGIFRLRKEISTSRVIGLRDFQVEKLRGSDFLFGMHPLKIDNKGIHVYPHVPETSPQNWPGKSVFSFGLANLDAMLAGGLESGTSTLLTGPSGVGKSTLATLFLRNNVMDGKNKAVFYSFEESLNSLRFRSAGLGVPVDELLDSGLLKFRHINPNECYPDEFLETVRNDVEDENRRFVAIDSLKGYELAMQEYGKPIPHLHHLASYLKNQDVTSLLTNESQTLSGSMRPNELVMSHLADNILVMRYAEHKGQIRKVIGCMKKRLGHFHSELRELRMRPQPEGLSVGESLSGLQAILATGGGLADIPRDDHDE